MSVLWAHSAPQNSSTCAWKSTDLKLKTFGPCDRKGTFQVLDSRGPQLPGASKGPPAGYIARPGFQRAIGSAALREHREGGSAPCPGMQPRPARVHAGCPRLPGPSLPLVAGPSGSCKGPEEPGNCRMALFASPQRNDNVCKGTRGHCLKNIRLQALGLLEAAALTVPQAFAISQTPSMVV